MGGTYPSWRFRERWIPVGGVARLVPNLYR